MMTNDVINPYNTSNRRTKDGILKEISVRSTRDEIVDAIINNEDII